MYSQDNDIYIYNFNTTSRTRITFDGVNGLIYNGVTDWVYEEEIYGTSYTFQWSDDCKSIAYLKLNDTQVNVYPHTVYENGGYPKIQEIRYPKPGDKNPIVSVHVWTENKIYELDIGQDKDIYIYDVQFKNSSTVVATRVNRQQNKKEFLIANIVSPQNKVIETKVISNQRNNESLETEGWIHHTRGHFFHKEKDIYYDIVPIDGYYHASVFNFTNGEFIRALSNGTFDDESMYGEIGGNIYINSARPVPSERSVVKVNPEVGVASEKVLTRRGNYWTASFGSKAKEYILVNNGPKTIQYFVKNIEKDDWNVTFDDNKKVMEEREEYEYPTYEFKKINTTNGYVEAMIQYPYKYKINRKYPLVVNVYGGPGSQRVKKSFNSIYSGLNLYLSTLGYVVCSFDGRGTGFKGEKYMKQVYKNLGEMEAQDSIDVGQIMNAESFVNEKKSTLWGWSYGGYVTLLASLSKQNVYKYGVSGAPVTDWKYYDSVYTERYMLQPFENEIGYKNSSCLNKVTENTKNETKTEILLIHGTGDDNVHLLNSLQMMTKLQEFDIQFDSMFYKDSNHGLIRESGKLAKHLFNQVLKKIK